MSLNDSTIQGIKNKVVAGEYRYTIHAFERCAERDIWPVEIEEVILSGEIIEDYPQDKYGPSCLIVVSLSFSPDGKRLVPSGADGNARVWDTTDGQLLLTLKGHAGAITGVDYSPDGRHIATASIDSTARLWDAASGEELLALGEHTSGLTSVAFYPDGKRLATSSLDGAVRIYALNLDDLLSLARQRLTRSLTVDECQRYLHMQECPP